MAMSAFHHLVHLVNQLCNSGRIASHAPLLQLQRGWKLTMDIGVENRGGLPIEAKT